MFRKIFIKIHESNIYSLLFLAVLGGLLYLPALVGGPVFDDNAFLFESSRFIEAPGPHSFWIEGTPFYRAWPLSFSLLWMVYWAVGKTYWVYHAINILLHVINSFLILGLIKRIKMEWALAVALLFLIHPMQIETVSWIFQFKTISAMTFFLLSYYCLLNVQKRYLWILAAIFFFFLSMAGKIMAFFVPLFFLFQLIRFWGVKSWKPWVISIPFVWMSLFFIGPTLGGLSGNRYENSQKKAFDQQFEASSAEVKIREFLEGSPLAYFGNLLPISRGETAIQIKEIFSNREFSDQIKMKKIETLSEGDFSALISVANHYVEKGAFPELKLVEMILTKQRSSLWAMAELYHQYDQRKDEERILLQLERDTPNDLDLLLQLGKRYMDWERYQQAEQYYQRLLKLNYKELSIYNALAQIYTRLKQTAKAEQILKMALKIYPQNTQVMSQLGEIYYQQKRTDEFVRVSKEILRLRPSDRQVIDKLLRFYVMTRQMTEEHVEYFYSLSIFDNKVERASLEKYLAEYYRDVGGSKAVIKTHLQRLFELDSRDHHSLKWLARLYVEAGDMDNAQKVYDKALQHYPNEISLLLDVARMHQKKGEWARVEGLYLEILILQPHHQVVLRELLEIYWDQGRWAEFEILMTKLLEFDPYDIEVGQWLLENYKSERKWNEAKEIAERILLVDDVNLKAHTFLIKYEKLMGNFQKAQEYYERLFRQNVGHLYLRMGLGELAFDTAKEQQFYQKVARWNPARVSNQLGGLYLSQGDTSNWNKLLSGLSDGYLLSVYGHYWEHYGETLSELQLNELLEKIKAVSADYVERDWILARIYKGRGNVAQAINHLHKVLDAFPDDVKAQMLLVELYEQSEQTTADARHRIDDFMLKHPGNVLFKYKLARYYKRKGNLPRSVDYYRAILAINPNNVEYVLEFGEVLRDLEKYDEAEKLISGLIKRFPLSNYYKLRLLECYIKQNRYADALRVAKKMMELNPYYRAAYYWAAFALREMGELEQAVYFQKKHDGTEGQTDYFLQELLGNFFYEKGNLKKAEQIFRGILNENRYQYTTYEPLIRVYVDMKCWDEAIAVYKRWLELSPQECPIREKLASLYMQLGKYEQAEAMWRDLIKSYPYNLEFRKNLYESCLRQEKLLHASVVLQGIEQINPTTRWLTSAKVELKQRQLANSQIQTEKNEVSDGVTTWWLALSNSSFYFVNFFLPQKNSLVYPIRDLVGWKNILSVAVFSICALLFGYFIRPMRFALMFYLVGILPVVGLYYVPYMKFSYVADHWAYMATFPLALMAILLFQKLFEYVRDKKWARYLTVAVVICLVANFSWRSVSYAYVFNDNFAVLERIIEVNPDYESVYLEMAKQHIQQGDWGRARETYLRAITSDVLRDNSVLILERLVQLDERLQVSQVEKELHRQLLEKARKNSK